MGTDKGLSLRVAITLVNPRIAAPLQKKFQEASLYGFGLGPIGALVEVLVVGKTTAPVAFRSRVTE